MTLKRGGRRGPTMPMRNSTHANALMLSLGGLILLAWAALGWLNSAPLGGLFHAHAGAHAHHGVGNSLAWSSAGLFIVGWSVMTIAMMLPTTLPLIAIFQRLTRQRSDGPLLVALVLAGYLLVWVTFGLAAYLLVAGLNALPAATNASSSWMMGAGLFLAAGAFQFSRLKYECLDKCRTPLSFVMSHWRGRTPRTEAFRLGIAHGAFCVGCCWALMLLMFAISVASVLWMLVLAILMGVEKNVSWGRRFAKPLGAVLIAVGTGAVGYHLL